jgi:hypothetical protein
MTAWAQRDLTPVEAIGESDLAREFLSLALGDPAWTRLEPQSISGDPRPGAEARIADPLWMLGRQWQFGELEGEDVGTPVAVHVRRRGLPVTAWAPATDGGAEPRWRAWPQAALLDELVEHIPTPAADRGVRFRAESGAQLQHELQAAGHAAAAAAALAAYPLSAPPDPSDPTGALDPTADRLLAVLGGSVPDGALAEEALVGGEPDWVASAANPDEVRTIVADWLAWMRGFPDAGGTWSTPRLEHSFWLRCGHGADQVVLRADEFGGGPVRWHDLKWEPSIRVNLDGDDTLEAGDAAALNLLASPLRYPGMPAQRYWQLEDGSVDVSAIEAQPHDLARLCLAEFALATGDDWLSVPVDATAGGLTQILEVSYTTTFGERVVVSEAGESRRARGFRMYEISGVDGSTLNGVLLPPVAAGTLEGPPVEEVLFLRDEAANMAWAVERVVAGRSGDSRQRSDEPRPAPPAVPDDVQPRDLVYRLQTQVPSHWIPLVPIATGYAQVGLRKGAMERDGQPVLAVGSLLAPTPLTFPAEEIPREGVMVRAGPVLARRPDGSYAHWTAYRVRVGRGEGSSQLAFDSAGEVTAS